MPMYSACRTAVLPAVGFPIRVSTDQWLFSAYSWLIAAVHALLRLLVPRHPPCALDILTVIFLDLAERARKEHARPYAAYTNKWRPARSACVSASVVCWIAVQFSRSAEKLPAGTRPAVSQNSTACRRRHVPRTAPHPDPVDV